MEETPVKGLLPTVSKSSPHEVPDPPCYVRLAWEPAQSLIHPASRQVGVPSSPQNPCPLPGPPGCDPDRLFVIHAINYSYKRMKCKIFTTKVLDKHPRKERWRRRLARDSSQQFPNPPLTGCQPHRATCVLCKSWYEQPGTIPNKSCNLSCGSDYIITLKSKSTPPRMRSRSFLLSMQLNVLTRAPIYPKEGALMRNNSDKLYSGQSMWASDEKLMINELGPYV